MTQWNKNPEWVELEDISLEKTTSKTGLTSDMLNKIVENIQNVKNTAEAIEIPIEEIQRNGSTISPVNGVVNISVPIESVKRNNTVLTPVSGAVNIDIPVEEIKVNQSSIAPVGGVVSILIPESSDDMENASNVSGETITEALDNLKASLEKTYDLVINTQSDFQDMLNSPTWYGAKSVLLKGEFQLLGVINIPSNVLLLAGFPGNSLSLAGTGGYYIKGAGSTPFDYVTTLEGLNIYITTSAGPSNGIVNVKAIKKCFIKMTSTAMESTTALARVIGYQNQIGAIPLVQDSRVELSAFGSDFCINAEKCLNVDLKINVPEEPKYGVPYNAVGYSCPFESNTYMYNEYIWSFCTINWGSSGLFLPFYSGGFLEGVTPHGYYARVDAETCPDYEPPVRTIILASEQWSEGIQTKILPGMDSKHNPTIVWENVSDDDFEAFGNAKIRISHNNNTLVFKALADEPNINITIQVQLTR